MVNKKKTDDYLLLKIAFVVVCICYIVTIILCYRSFGREKWAYNEIKSDRAQIASMAGEINNHAPVIYGVKNIEPDKFKIEIGDKITSTPSYSKLIGGSINGTVYSISGELIRYYTEDGDKGIINELWVRKA
jgi:hypothetical protein